MKDAILFRRKQKLLVKNATGQASVSTLAGALDAFLALGFCPTKALVVAMQSCSDQELIEFVSGAKILIAKALGAHKSYKPMYPGFPKQVIEASEAELYLNALFHYLGDWFGVRIMPDYPEEKREKLSEKLKKAKVLDLGRASDLEDVLIDLFAMKAAPSPQDVDDIKSLIGLGVSVKNIRDFQNKEILALAFSLSLRNVDLRAKVLPQVKTATDVMRIATVMSNGDAGLTERVNFVRFSRTARKMFLALIDGMPNAAEDMMRYRVKWKRLGERLHPGEFADKFPSAAEAFRKIRNEGEPTFAGKVDNAIRCSNYPRLVSLLKSRPGEFARRLDKTLSDASSEDRAAIVEEFAQVADRVSTPVLWQVYGHFAGRELFVNEEWRISFPKGINSKPVAYKNTRLPLREISARVASIASDAIYDNFAAREKMGKVWIDPICKNLLIPSFNKTASEALRSVGRGSRFPIEKDTVRLFMYWKNQKGNNDIWHDDGRVDLDLSAVMYDENWEFIDHVSWTQLRSGWATHSGDITSAPDGAAEFLDINIPNAPHNARYISVSVISFTGQKLCELDEAFAGWMERESPQSGEIFEPLTVENRFSLTAPATSVNPMILDLKTKEIIWADMTLKASGSCYRADSNMSDATMAGRAVSSFSKKKASLMELFATNVIARDGTIVETRAEADLVIAEDGNISPFDAAAILGTWL